MQGSSIEPCLRGCGDGCEAEYNKNVSTHAVVLVNGFGVIHTSIDARGIVLRYSHDSLDSEEDVRDKPEDAMGRGKMGASMGKLVVFDDYEGGEEGQNRSAIDDGVYVGANSFLLRGVRGLEDENGLCGQK